MEKSKIQLARVGTRAEFPAQCLILSTTNLCPCGKFQPETAYQCRCSSLRLRNYLDKLTGPFLDRFTIFHLTRTKKVKLQVSLKQIKEQVEEGRKFQVESRQQTLVNQSLDPSTILEQFSDQVDQILIPHSTSLRRRNSLLRVARTLADLEFCQEIKPKHLEQAQFWTAHDMYQLERFRLEDFAMRQPL